ncbi:MAG: hypothetical protein ACTHOB_02945 [Ginsengibacter sp.]
MKLQVTETTSIKDLQKEFSKVYPFLKIEFFKTSHLGKMFYNDKLFSDIVLSEIARFLKPGSIHIDKHCTITQLEEKFYNKFGIALQVSHRSKGIFISGAFTDNMTLKEQNEVGKQIDQEMKIRIFQGSKISRYMPLSS